MAFQARVLVIMGETKVKPFAAEFMGTFWLVLGGCGSAVLAAAFPNVGIGLLGVAWRSA
jgi:aquaporin Z